MPFQGEDPDRLLDAPEPFVQRELVAVRAVDGVDLYVAGAGQVDRPPIGQHNRDRLAHTSALSSTVDARCVVRLGF